MKHKLVQQHKYFTVKENVATKKNRNCPRCGDGVSMAQHKQNDGKTRYYCGKCHMSIWE